MAIDIFLLLFAIAGFWLGYTKGIVGTLFSIVSYAVAFLLTLKLAPWFVSLLIKSFNMDKTIALIIGTLGLMLMIILLIRWLVKSVENYHQKSKLSAYSKVQGGIIMLLIGMLVFSYVLWTVNEWSLVSDKAKQSSITYSTLQKIPEKGKAFLAEFKPLFSRYWELMQQTFEENKTGSPG